MTTSFSKPGRLILGALLWASLLCPLWAAEDMTFDMGKGPASTSAPAASAPAAPASVSPVGKLIHSLTVAKDGNSLEFHGTGLEKPSARKSKGKILMIFKDTKLSIPPKIGGAGLVKDVRSSRHGADAWVVVDEDAVVSYDFTGSGDEMTMNLSGGAQAPVPAADKKMAAAPAVPSAVASPESYDKRTYTRLLDASLRPVDGSVKIVLTSDGPAKYTVRQLSTPEKLVIHFMNTHLDVPAKEQKVQGDSSLVSQSGLLSMEIRQIGQNFSPISEVLLTLVPGTTYQINRNLNQVVVGLTAPPQVEKPKEKKGDINQLISADLAGADLNAVLRTLGDEAGFDVDMSSAPVTGTVNETFKNIPLKNALSVLLAPGDYIYEVQGNVLRIGTQETLTNSKKNLPQVTDVIQPAGGMTPEQLENLVGAVLPPTNTTVTRVDTVRNVLIVHGTASDVAEYKQAMRDLKLEPGEESDRITKVVKLNYADPETMMNILKTYLTPVGHVQEDPRTQDLVIWEVPENMGVLLELIKEMDVKAPQVLIESNLVEVSDEKDLNLGISWAANKAGGSDTFSSAATMLPSNLTGTITSQPEFTFGTVKDGAAITAELQALETKKKGKIISRPRIATASGVPAEIDTTQNVIIQSIQNTFVQGVGENQTITYSQVPVPINLKVTPRITDDGRITTQMAVTVTSITGTAPSGAPPPTTVETAQTTITTRNGETIVIGGLVQDTITEEEDGVPLLQDIPILGALFQSKAHIHQKQELIIFVTPTLIED